MTQQVLEATETDGAPFRSFGGQYQVIVDHGGGTVKLQIEIPNTDPPEYIDTDETWTADGVRAMWLAFEASYRMQASVAGSVAYLQAVHRLASD